MKSCETCAVRPAWPLYAQCATCLRYRIRPESDPGTGEVPRIRFMVTLPSEDNSTATHLLRQQRERWEQQHPGWIPRYLNAFSYCRGPARGEPLGRYVHEVRFTLRRQRYPQPDPYQLVMSSNRWPIDGENYLYGRVMGWRPPHALQEISSED